MTASLDREMRARINKFAHRLGQRTAQETRQRITECLDALRAAGADRTVLGAFLTRCEQAGHVLEANEIDQ